MPPKKKRRGRPPKAKETQPPALPKKRGRPFKNPPAAVEVVKKKRGRPFKNPPVAAAPVVKKRRGRKPKIKFATTQTEKAVVDVKVAPYDHFVEAKLYISERPVSKQDPEFTEWAKEYYSIDPSKDHEALRHLSNSLDKIIRRVLIQQKSELHSIIPLIHLVRGCKTIQVFFDLSTRGAIVEIWYPHNAVPSGVSASQKTTLVCNQFNAAIKSILPLGVCG